MARRVKEKSNIPIVVRQTTRNRLEKEIREGETLDKLITRLLDLNEKVNKPSILERWRRKDKK